MPVAILVHGDRSRMIGSPTSWKDLMIKIKRFLSVDDLDEDKLILVVHPDWSNTPLELDSSALFDFRLPDKSRITITLDTNRGDIAAEDDDDEKSENCEENERHGMRCDQFSVSIHSSEEGDSDWDSPPRSFADTDQSFNVFPKSLTGKTIIFPVRSDMTVLEAKILYQHMEGIPPDQPRFIHGGLVLDDERKLSDYPIEEGSTIHSVLKMRGAKPAIYLLTPGAIPSLGVAIELSDDWELTVLYPPIKAAELLNTKSPAAWTVDVKGSGIMADHATAMDTSCLFWEAESVLPKDGRVINKGIFTPHAPDLTLARSRLTQRDELVPYLYKCLEALCLTPTMRTDFITFWLPKFYQLQENNFDVALNFVKQTEYEEAARLSFSQEPDAVVRIFMVFGGVLRDTEEHARWMADQGGPETPDGWRDVVGISKEVLDIMADQTKFRAVEWGAMHAVPSM